MQSAEFLQDREAGIPTETSGDKHARRARSAGLWFGRERDRGYQLRSMLCVDNVGNKSGPHVELERMMVGLIEQIIGMSKV